MLKSLLILLLAWATQVPALAADRLASLPAPILGGELSNSAAIDHGVGSTDHFSALKIWMFENKFVFLPSHLKTIEPMARPIMNATGTGE